jgi:hypothetical protein
MNVPSVARPVHHPEGVRVSWLVSNPEIVAGVIRDAVVSFSANFVT